MSLIGKARAHFENFGLWPQTRRVMKDRLTYLSVAKLKRIQAAITETAHVPGDIVEFGVALGGSGIILAHAARGSEKKFHGFDVFGMIPEPTSDKDDLKSKQRYDVIKSGQSEGIDGEEYYGYRSDLISDVRKSFYRHGASVNDRDIILHKGLFEETWGVASVECVSLVHIDCDWYDPVKFCLEKSAGVVSVGGNIIIDDYNDYGGCRIAVDEFVEVYRNFSLEMGPNPILRRTA
ncbi:hypothetical protein GCM10009424_21430 [Sphingomonas ursincola]|uniref:Asparagine synthase n=1 Tax=Sphingomonas ursincola TaxID=56361 RepID=A0A7V8RCE5_9SPHN|nr:TylF/MycF/NovP-related O-methyltransferase [Sphingomonas ursincola]MBA1373888.1 asparagine synthase [Sphingomonas ursincola]